MENYEKKYKDALERAKEIVNDQNASSVWKGWLCNCFPELKKNEDEKIRKWILGVLSTYEHDKNLRDAAIAWLKKQAEQKLVDNVKPRFKVGDWITNGATNPVQISSIKDGIYFTHNDTIGGDIESIDKEYHLWDIQDAKDGDVLTSNRSIFIFSQEYIAGKPEAYCGIMNGLFLMKPEGCWTNEKCYPATKEERDTLFAKMKETGYEWDAEKKELKKIENEIEIPFGAKDSELQEATYYIPKGFHAKIYDDKVVFKKAKKPTAWSEEDEVRLQACLDTLQARSIMGKVDTIMIIWLKSLKDRILPQPKQEWSEEDEEHVNSLLKRLEGLCRKEFATTRFAINEDENWLKSLRPQNRWKPSDKQMTALRRMKAAIAGEGEIYKPLNSLYEDLKKLREE